MKVLFVLSGNKDKTSDLTLNQAQSLLDNHINLDIDFYTVIGKGFIGYSRNIKLLRQKIKNYNPDIIHAHYSFCGFLSLLTFSRKPIVTSLMGSDVNLKPVWQIIVFIASVFWKTIIVKSEGMKKKYLLTTTQVIPNGVDFNKYRETKKEEARRELGLDVNKIYLLFMADPKRHEKNFKLVEEAYQIIKTATTELLVVQNIPHTQTRLYYYAVDIVLSSSLYEGSPNVIKEAMVCNCPIVSTNVGDVKNLFNNVKGNYITSFSVKDFSEKILLALKFAKTYDRTSGRKKIAELGIDAKAISRKIVSIYNQVSPKSLQIISSQKQICEKGVWDETIPGIQFDVNGLSNYSHLQEKMMRDYPQGNAGKIAWQQLVDNIKSSSLKSKYDCLVGVSGGVDSSYLLHICKTNGLRPLAVHLDNGFNSEISTSNIYKITNALNIDLITLVVNYEEMKDLFKSYMRAALPWIDGPTDIAIKATMYAVASKYKIKYIIRGNDFRSEGKQPKEWTYIDNRQLKYIHKKFGSGIKLKTYPQQSFLKMIYAGVILRIKDIRPFYFLNYNMPEVKLFLMNTYGWKDYGGHHHENLFTKFTMAYWLPKKFNIDKRKISLSAQVLNNSISREDALNQLSKPFDSDENLEELKMYILKKLYITLEQFDTFMLSTNKNYTFYPSNYKLIFRYIKYFKWLIKRLYGYKPMSLESNEMIK